jgi:hypothetical protein
MSSPPGVALPPDLQKILDDLDGADAAADALAADLTDEQFRWQPDEGRRWSVGQCLEHLAKSNATYGVAMRDAVEEAKRRGWSRRGPLAPGFFGRQFIASLEPPVKRRTRAPGKILPQSQLTRAEIMRRYHDAHEQVREIVQASASIDANRSTFKNPFLGLIRVKVATGLRVITAHDRRHLWQAQQVIRRPDFPRRRPTDR